MKTWWLSWWDPIDGKNGKHVDGIVVWVSGTRDVGERTQDSCVALVIAPTEAEAWAKAEKYYPGAISAEQRFSEEHELGWRPGDRFPVSAEQEAKLKHATLPRSA